MEPPSFSTTGPQIIRAAPGGDASIVLPLPSGSPPFEFEWSRAGAKLDDRFKKSDDAGGVRLTITAARTADSGVYTLQASNAAGKDTTRVRLEVSPDETPTGEDPPNFLRRLQDLTVKVGTRTRFLVEIVSSTECRVTWYRNERRLLEAERIALVRDGNFWCADISAVSVDDAGRWTCTAENVGGRASCSAHLNVLVPKAYKRPEFVEELRALLTEQGTVSLECKVVGVPTPVLRWFKDSREIKAGDVFALTANAEDPTSLGTYTCEAVNCMGRAYSSSKVHVVGRVSKENLSRPSSGGITPEPPPIFTKELEDQFVRICEPLTLSCHIVVPPWPRNVVWYNKEGKIEPSERYHVLEDGVGGYLLEVPSAEWPDEGEWKCVATSSGGRVGISTCYVSMDVPKNYRKPRFMENLQAVLTEEGLVSFECKVVGFPTPLLSWFKDGQELKPGDVYQLTGTNSLGSYCCIARNCMGQASSSAELTVEDIQNQLNEDEKLQLFSKNQAPKFLQGLKSVEAKIDEPFRFTIKVAIPPEPTVLWYRDDQPVDESCRCHLGKEERGVFFLDIQNLEFMDQAEWKCVAMNDYGHSVTSCFLKLIIPRHFKKPRFLENLQAILSDEGAVNLECKVIGVPQPVLKWYKDGEELKPGDIHRIISGQDGTCCLGTYTCEAQNCMGIAASSASLLGFEDSIKAKNKTKANEQALQRNLSLSTIHEERTSQMYDTPVGDMTLDEKGEISFSFDGKEVSVSLYETPDLTEEEALQIVEMYADQLSENVTEHNVVELPPLRFVKETSTSGNLLMEAIIIDVSPEYFTSPEEDLRTEADIEDISIADDNGPPQLSLDIDADGEDYLEKTIALLSDEKSDLPKKIDRKKSDSQRSADDYFSLSRDQSLSEEKKDDDTQMLSESDLQSFASARSSGKPKSKSSKPSVEDGQESSDVTKTVLLREDLQNQTIETDISAVKHKKTRRSSGSLRRSSSGSEKSLSKMKEDIPEIKTESVVNLAKKDLNKEKVKTAMNGISVSLTEVINEIQILERDIILKSEFMSTAATASNSLEIINSLITPLSEIHSITDAIRETVEYSENITSLLNNLPESLQNLQHSLTIISKCIDVESENKTLVTKTCMSIIKKCGQQLHNIIKDINTTVYNECQFDEKIRKSNIEIITTDLISIINCSLDMVNSEENKKSERDENVEEPTLESKHLHDTQKAIHDLRGSLRSLLFIVEEVDIPKATSFLNIKKSEILLNDMSTPIQDLQSALEQIETLSVMESKSDLQKYNTEIIETAMESVLKLRTSFEKLSAEASNMEDKHVLSEVLNEIKFNIKKISIQLDELEAKTGKFDILNNDNKLEALQKMAQILINLENNLGRLENVSSVKYHMTEFHKNLTKLLENVIESNDANKYFSLLEICDAVNRMNTSIKSIESNSELSLASINNTLKIIQTNISNNVFKPELNSSLMSSIAKVLVCIQETINKAEELSLNENLEDVKDLSIAKCEDSKVNVLLENIEQTIAAISNVISHETAKDMTLKKAIENVCPILVDLKYCVASLNFTSSDKNENLSDLESLSFSQSVANPLIELYQTISVINQVLCENADSQDVSQLLTDYAKPLLDLCDTLEILQHDVVSQCIENEPHFDISSSIANVVENLKSCIVMIQEQPIIEGTDDMSTLDDISGIKTTADILSGDEFMIATVKENENVQYAENLTSESGKVLHKLKYHITTLQNSDVLNILEPVEFREKSSIKSFIIGLDEIHAKIESILYLTTMESNQKQMRFMNLSKLIEIIPLLKDMQRLLSDIDIDTIPTKTHETNPEKCFIIKENIKIFKSYLNYCLEILLPAIEITDNIVDVSTKIVNLRQSCEELSSIFSKLEECIESHKEIKTEISRLDETVKLFLETTTYQNTSQIKCEIENLYKVIVIVQDELNQLASIKPELLSKDNIFIQIIHDVEKYIVALEQCNFVNLCDLNIAEKDVVVAKSEVSEECINEEDSLMIYLKELMTHLEFICNQLIDKKKVLESELLEEKTYKNIEMLDLELSKGKLSNLNETIEKLEQYLSFGNMCVNGDDINMAIKLSNTINDILSSIEHLKMSEGMKTVYQSLEVIKNLLGQILSIEKDNEKQILFKGKAEALLQHMDHYIEIIELVEEVSAVIKLENLKESANIVRELKQSLINTELSSEDSIQNPSKTKIKEEQAEIAQRLHKALVSVQIHALESPRELEPTVNEDIRQQILEVVSDIKNDLIALAGTSVILEESLITAAFESDVEYQEQNAKFVLEKRDQLEEIAKEEICVETKQLTEYNELDNGSELLQITDSNTNKRLNLLNQLKEGEQDTLNAGLNLDELKPPPERDETKSEKLTTINEILIKNIHEYNSENTLTIISKLSHPLHSEHLKKTVDIAEQLLNTILSENISSEKKELSNFSTKQIELILSLNEAILIMYQTTIEESQELENKVGKDELQSFKNVVTNLRSTLQEIINNIKSLPSVSDIDEFQQEEKNIKDLVEHIVPTEDKIISDSYQIGNIKDLECNIANNNLLEDINESLEESKNLLSNESDNYNQDKEVALETEELYAENKDGTIIISTIDQSIQCMEFDTQLGNKKISINKEEVINHLREYFSEETVNVINNLSSLFKLEDIQQSVQIAHQLYDSLSSSESEIYYMSTQQLKLALLLEKTVSLLLESTVQETNELKNIAEKSELLKTNNVMNNLCNDLKMLIKITLIDTSLSTLDLDDLKVLITKEPFKYEIIVSNSSDKTTSKETISENISCIKQLDLPISSVTEAIDDSINYAVEPEITSVISDDKNLIQEKTVEVSPEDLKEKLQSEDFKDDNSIIKLESLLKEVNDMIDSSCDDNLEVIQNSLDEVQTIIMKMKSDFDGSIDDSINETLEDLECNVRSFQLQIIEHSPQVLLKEACVHLQTLVTHISKLNEVEEVLKPTTIKVANDVLDECSNDARQTIEFIEKVSSSGSTQHLEHIISNLNQIKDLLKSVRLKFLTNADTLIMGGVETVQSLDQIEERIFCLEKDLESQKNVDPITRDNIISAVHCVYGSISNMRGTISCVQKKYMYENYGKPSRYFLTSIKNVMELVKKEKHTKHWKQFAQSLRKVLNHFEDIKFYINFDKTARLPGDAAFTKIILGELVSVLSNEVVQDVGSLDPEVIKNVYDCIKCINRKLSDIEKNTILEVKEKIPIFNDLSIKILDLTKNINKFMQNEMMIENDKDKIKSDLTPSLSTNLDKQNMNEEETDENTKTDNIKLLFKDNVNNELTQTLPEIIEKSENANILQHQVESEVLQSNENKKMPTNTDFEDKYIVQTEEILLEKEIFSQSDINLMEENNTDIHAKEKIEIDFPETTCEKEVSKENQEKTSGSHLLVKNHTMLQNTDHQKSSEIVSNDKNDKHDNQVDLENNNAEKQTWYQETKQVEEGKICDKGEKEVISDVDEKKESLKIKDYEENDSESKDQSKNFESKKQDEQQKEAILIIEGKVEESINTFVENGNIPKDKSTPHKKKSNEQSNKYDNGEEQNIANVEENKELIKSLGNEENNTGNEVQFKKDFKKQEQKHQETQLSIESAVQETVNTSVENADIPCDMSKPHEMKPVKKSEISDDVIANVKEKQECVKDMEKKDDEKSNTGKDDQFKEQEQQQIESVSTIESKVAESVKSSVEHLDTLTEKSKPQETKKIVESTICDNDEKQVFTNLEEKTEVIQESETKDYGERSFDKEDKFKKGQEQQQIESVSTIDSKVSESVNTTVEHIDTPTEKSKHQETKKIVESTIYDNDKKQVIINLEEKTEVIKESGTKDYGERTSDKEDQFKKEFIEQEQQQIESEATINSKVAESVNTTVEHIDTPTEKSKPQEMKQVVESTICDINEKQVPTEVEEKTEVIKELEIKEYGEISSGKKDQFKKELKEHEQQQIENVATIESKLAESVNTSMENINMPIDKSKPQEMKQIIESAICDNNEKQVITNLEEKAEVIRELGTKEYGERSSDKEDKFKKEFKEQQLQQIESVSTIESKVTESVNSSVEHIDARTEKSKPQERKQIVESTIGDNDEKQDIINVEEKTEVIKELATREYGESSSSKDDQFKKEHKVQEQQEIANVVTTESKGVESVNTSVEHINEPTEKSKSQEMKQIVESKICDNDEKQIITEVEEKTEVIKESGTKEYGERRSDHEDQFKKELNDQEQQQMESVSTIESKVAESVNTSGENINMPIEESKPQEMNQIIENTICDNGEKQDITNVEEKTEAIKEMATKEYGESSSSKDDQFQKEHKVQEQQEIANVVTTESKSVESVNTSVEHIIKPTEKSKSQEMKQIVESKICDNDEKQVITKVKEKTEVIKESGTKDYGERNSDKEDQFKKGLNEQEQQQIESEATIESKAAESVNTSVENIVMTTDIFQPQGMKQVLESTICDDGKKQVTANINETEESIKTTEIREYEVSSTSEDDQYKKEYEEQKQQQKKSISTIESTVPESLNDSAENINMPLEKSTIKNGNEKCIEEVTNVIKSFEEIAEFQTQENNSVLSNIETKEDFVKEKAETGKEIKKHLVESFYQEKSSDNQDRNTEKPINKAMETSDYDNLYVQVQEEVEKDDESKIESKQKKCFIEKEDDTKSIEVSQTLTYKDDSTEAQVLQQEITEINDTKNDKKLDAVENVNTININSKHKIVLEIDTEKQPSEVDIVTKRQDELLYEEDVESANSNEHIIKQDRFDILDLSQPKQKENNQDASKIKDNKSAIANIDIPVQLHIDDKIKEGTLNQIDNKTSTEHIDNEHTQKEKEMKNKAETKKEVQNLIKEEMKDSKLKKSLDAKQVGYSDLEEKMRENIRKTKVEIITDLGEIDQEVTSLNNFLQNEENAEIKIETDPFRHDIDVRSDFSVKESITQVASKSEDELKVSTHKLEQNSSYLIEDTCCKKMENNTDSERSEFKEDINQNIDKSSIIKEYFEINLEKKTENGNKILDKVIDSDDREHPINITDVSLETSKECKDKENLTEMKKNKEICSKSQNIQLENNLSKENKEINDNKQETIKTKQNKKVIKNQDNESQSKAATAKKDEAEINIDKKQESISLLNKDYETEVKILSDVDNQSNPNMIDTNLHVENQQVSKQSNESLKGDKNNLSKEDISNLKKQEENIDNIINLEHLQVDKHTQILEQTQQLEAVFDNVENSEKLIKHTQEHLKGQEELKSQEQVQAKLLTKEISEREEGKTSARKQQKEKRRVKKLPETSKHEADVKSEVKPQETENNDLDKGKKIDDMNLNVVNVELPSTKAEDGNDIFIKEGKQNQDKQETIEQENIDIQHNKLETKMSNKFPYEEEVENKKETDKLTRQINEKEIIQRNENKKEYAKELNRKERQDSNEENKIKDQHNSEEKVITDKYFEKIKDYDIIKQLKDGTTSIKKDIREVQKSNEERKMNTIADSILTNVESEFCRPPVYVAKPYGIEDTVSQIQINNNKAQTIYKAQTLRHESQLRYSMPPHIDKALNTIEGRSQIKENNKAASECRSTLSEKRCSSSRYIKRKPVFSTFLTDRTAVESSRVKLTCSVLTNIDPRITWYKNGVQLENKHKFRSKFVDGLITLEILNALPSDSGEYSCSVENENGLVTSSANLKVYPSFEASPIPPTFTRSIRDNYHLAENELVLECRIRGQPLPTITWLKNDKPIISERYQAHYLADGVCRLTISNPTTEDSGKYTCKAESSVWSDEITHDVYFTGKKSPAGPNIATAEKLHFSRLGLESRRPHFTNVLSDHKVVTGGTIGLQVEIRGSPTRVEWLREGHSVTELYRNAQTYVDHDIYTLALSDVTEKESGLYTCRAYSNQGNVDMNASITVVQPNQYDGKPASIISRPEKDVIISVGEDLNISFRVHGEPKAKVFFMKGIRDLSNSQRVCKMTSDDYVKFTLKRTVVSDAGTYCIFAKNAYGCDRAFVTVVIRQRASSDNLISDWTYPMDDLAISFLDRNYKSVPDRIPSEPSVVDGGNNWISLAWPKSDHQSRAPILAYKVESWLLGKEGGARWAELGITPRNSFDAFNLKQGEEYHFRVTPRNRYGWGESVQTSVPIGIGLAGDRPEFVEILPGQLKVLVGEKAILRCSFTGKPMPEIVWMKNGHEIEEEIGRVTIQINNFQTSLQIEEVKINDEGRYSCEATNIHGRTSTYARMAVISDRQIWQADAKLKRERSAGIDGEYPPQFTMRLRDRRVQATYPVRLTCQVVGNPSPVVKWFKNEEEVIIGGRYTASQDEYFYTLEIAPTTLEDGGVYEAMARNGCGAVSCRCSLVVDKGIRAYIAPEFCCGLEPLYRLSEGEELRISAIVEAYPSVGVTWYRDGVRLRPSRRAIMTLDRDGQIELALASVTGRDAGVYTCTASNEVGMASTSGKVEILSGEYVIEKSSAPPIVISSDVPYSKEPMFIRKPRSSEAREGDTVIIECEVTGDPKPDVYWLRDFLKPDYYRDSSHFKRIGAGPAYRFEIPHAKLDYTGAYSIVAKNIHGETKAIISLQILAKDPTCGDDVHNIKYGRVEVIPRFDKELTDLLCYDGDAVEFECSVSGNSDPDIRWFHYNEIIPECPDFETSYDVGTARLKIKQVTAEDEGTYTCEASNGLGKASSSACLVVYPPGEPNTLSTRLRRPPALLSAASTPRSTPRTTPARSMSRTPGPEPRRLCSPSREIAPKFYTYPFNRVAEEGDTVVFQCAVKGLPQPWATWDKDGIIITPSARITIKEKDEMLRILEIEQVTIEDVGLYRISLENDYGRAEASARLEVITQKGKFYGSTRSFSVSPRKTLPYRRRTPSSSK